MIVIELGFWTGIAGLAATGVLVFGATMLAKSGGVPMSYPIPIVIGVAFS